MKSSVLSYEDFRQLVAERSIAYLRAALFLVQHKNERKVLTRPLVGELLSYASQVEELLDSYGARNNCAGPLFVFHGDDQTFFNISYELLHIQYSLPHYHLLPVQQDFAKSTEQTLLIIERDPQKSHNISWTRPNG